jgi:hypothetical protein
MGEIEIVVISNEANGQSVGHRNMRAPCKVRDVMTTHTAEEPPHSQSTATSVHFEPKENPHNLRFTKASWKRTK